MPRKRQSTKSRIVKSAWNLFYKNGYDDTTVEDIITASAVTPTMSMADDAKKAEILKTEDAGLTLAGVEW